MTPQDTINAGTIHTFEYDLLGSRETLAQRLAQPTIILLICASILAPGVFLSPDTPWFKLEVLALPFILLAYTWLLLAGLARPFRFNGLFVVGALYSLSVAISMVYGSAILGQAVIVRDFYDFPMLWLPVLFFTLAYEGNLSEFTLRRLLAFFSAAVSLVCLYAWAQWANLGFAQWLNYNVYAPGTHIQDAFRYARRVYSTMNNANILGELMTWSIAAFLLATWQRVGNHARNIFMTVACLITLAMTGSRYGILNTALAFFLVAAVLYVSGTRLSRLLPLFLFFPLFAATIYFVASSNQRTLERYQTLENPWTTDSFRQRADAIWLDVFQYISQSPLLGRGPARTTFEELPVTDSEFLDVLKKFGIIGFLFYLGYFLVPLQMLWRGMRIASRAGPGLETSLPATFLVMRLSFIMIVTALAMNIGMSTFYNHGIQGFLWMWMGLGAAAAKSIEDASNSFSSPFCAPFSGEAS